MAEHELRASYAMHSDFSGGLIWHDYANEIHGWLEDVRDRLETETDPMESRRFQGIAEACRRFLSLPQVFVAVLEEKSDGREE